MANSILLPYSINKTSRTPRRRHWRRYTTTISSNQQIHSSSTIYSVHKSTSNLPDIVNDCYSRENNIIQTNQQMKLTCKQIAHSLRIVADQVDKKYCQDDDFNQNLQYLSIRLVLHATHIRTILCTLWTRSFVPFILLICKTKTFF